MQRLGSPSIFPKLKLKLPPGTRPWECQSRRGARYIKGRQKRRTRTPLRNTFPNFEVSSLLLDLDAEGAQGVRAYDPKLDPQPESKKAIKDRELQPVRERVAAFEQQYEECESNFASVAANKLHPLQINGFDLLAVSILAAPKIGKTATDSDPSIPHPIPYADELDTVLHKNGIPRSVRGSTSRTIPYMLRRREFISHAHGSSPIGPNDEEELRLIFASHPTFFQLDRIVTRMMKTPEGCQILSKVNDELHVALIHVSEDKPTEILALLNNLLINLYRHGLPLSAKLYELGILASLKCQAIGAAHDYLTRRLECGHLDNDFITYILEKLLRTSIVSPHSTVHEYQLNPSSRLTTMFSLLTGYIPGEDQLTVSLRDLVSRERHDQFHLYIQCLARLGAFRTIWHEWHLAEFSSREISVLTADGSPDLSRSREMAKNSDFVTAVLNALVGNIKMTDLANLPEFLKYTRQFQEDCQLDMVAISRSANMLASSGNEIRDYASNPSYAVAWDRLFDALQEEKIGRMLPALQVLLRDLRISFADLRPS